MNQVPPVGRYSPLAFARANPIASLVIVIALATIALLARYAFQLQQHIAQLRNRIPPVLAPDAHEARHRMAQAEEQRDRARDELAVAERARDQARAEAQAGREAGIVEIDRLVAEAEGIREQGRREVADLNDRIAALEHPVAPLAEQMAEHLEEIHQHALDAQHHLARFLALLGVLPEEGGQRADLEAAYLQLAHPIEQVQQKLQGVPQILRPLGMNIQRQQDQLRERGDQLAGREGEIQAREGALRQAQQHVQAREAAAQQAEQAVVAKQAQLDAREEALARREKLLAEQRQEFAEARKQAAAAHPAVDPQLVTAHAKLHQEHEQLKTDFQARAKRHLQESRDANHALDAEKEKVREANERLQQLEKTIEDSKALVDRLRCSGRKLKVSLAERELRIQYLEEKEE